MAREPSGWGTCIRCGETLTPEDAERLGWSDRCEFCLKKLALWSIINKRTTYIKKQIAQVDTEMVRDSWNKKLEIYRAIADHIKKIEDLKREVWGESYPEEY